MLRYIYALPLRQIIALMLITIPLWAFGQLRQGRSLRTWQIVNGCLFVLAVGFIVTTTVVRRTAGAGEINLVPFSSFVQARTKPELYREMLMNVLLFFPLGLSLSSALPQRMSIGRRIGLTLLAGLVLSLSVEVLQFVFQRGLAETDDLLTNTFGAALGSSQLLLSRVLRKLKR